MSAPPANTTRPQNSLNLLNVLTPFAAAGTMIATVLTFAAFAARWHWRLEQACYFRVQYFWSLCLAALVLWAAKRRRIALLAFVAAGTNLAVIAPIYWPSPVRVGPGPRLRVISFNLLRDNPEQAAVMQFLRRERADIVLLMEVTLKWANELQTLRDEYPHQHVVPRSDAFGIALLSPHGWNGLQILDLGHADLPTIVAQFDSDQRSFTFIGTHPLPPGSPSTARERNAQLAAVANFARNSTAPIVLAGDLNTTEYSPYFRDLLIVSGLCDSRQGRGIQASWGPLPGFEIAIDHCLVSPQIVIRNRRVGPHLGSDHRPVIVDFSLATK